MRIVVSGGGTAGHISPILATVEALKKLEPEVEFLYIGMAGGMEESIATSAGLAFKPIQAGKYRRYAGRKLLHVIADLSTLGLNARDTVRVAVGYVQSLRILRAWQPDIVFIKGGYVGLPVGLAARTLRIPYVIHESDIDPGLANRLLAKHAVKIATGFPVDRYKNWPTEKLSYVGSPIRREVLKGHRLEGLAAFELSTELPMVMVVGGSSGAQRINEAVLKALPELITFCQVLHVTGERDIEHVRFSIGRMQLKHPERYVVTPFIKGEIGQALAAADLVVSRAGSNSLMELAALGKPAIIIPASQLHDQTINAQFFARANAIRVITDDKLRAPLLVREIRSILEGEGELERLGTAISAFAKPKAATDLARLILDSVGQGSSTT